MELGLRALWGGANAARSLLGEDIGPEANKTTNCNQQPIKELAHHQGEGPFPLAPPAGRSSLGTRGKAERWFTAPQSVSANMTRWVWSSVTTA